MRRELNQFYTEVYDAASALSDNDRLLLEAAQHAALQAYAPYSEFRVGAAAEMANGEIVTGSNQENISFPAGLCAEGVALAAAASRFPGMPIRSLAVSYRSSKAASDHPISPCGICRQSLQEFAQRTGSPIRLILGGLEGKVIIVDAADLLPLAFRF